MAVKPHQEALVEGAGQARGSSRLFSLTLSRSAVEISEYRN